MFWKILKWVGTIIVTLIALLGLLEVFSSKQNQPVSQQPDYQTSNKKFNL